jgi:hypothetical protein
MTTRLFDLTFLLAVPLWALMILTPCWQITRRVLTSPLVVVPLLLVYAALVLPALGLFWEVYRSPTLSGVQDLLATDRGTAAIWAHLNAFDVFVGRWMYLDSRERDESVLLMAALLLLTILFSPLGLLAYLVFRAARTLPGLRPSDYRPSIGP